MWCSTEMTLHQRKRHVAAASFCLVVLLWSATPSRGDDHSEDQILNGTILDQTITPWGGRFYRAFADALQTREGLHFNLLVVEEKPYTQGGSLIAVSYNDQLVYQTVVFAGARQLASQAQSASNVVAEILLQSQLGSIFFNNDNPDIDGRSDL